jgi:hypothetical protein
MTNLYYLLEEHLDDLDWYSLYHNSSACPFVEKHYDRLNSNPLFLNSNSIRHFIVTDRLHEEYLNDLHQNQNIIEILLEHNPNKINWDLLSQNPNSIPILEKNIDRINWHYLSRNPNENIWKEPDGYLLK